MRSHQNSSSVTVLGILGTCALLAVLGCQGGPFIKITLDGRNAKVTKILFSGTIGTKSIMNKEFSNNSDLSYITVSLPEGTRGMFDVDIKGLLDDDCVTATGSTSFAVTDDKVYGDVRIQLREISTCGKGSYTLKTANVPSNFGQILSDPPGIDCGSTCSASFREGTRITLKAIPQPGATFTGWNNVQNCNSNWTCDVTLTSDLTIQALFSGCTGWCNETPSMSKKTLYAINGQDASSIVAVGAEGTILVPDGNGWASDTSGITTTLRGVSAPLDNRISFAVGDKGKILIPKWGKDWSLVPVTTSEMINGVVGSKPDKMFAVGNKGTFLHCGSMGCIAVPGVGKDSCPGLVQDVTLNAIATAKGGDAHFLIGNSGLFLQRTSPIGFDKCTKLPSQTSNNLFGLWVGVNNVYLVGAQGTIVKCDALGSSCVKFSSGTTYDLHGIWGANSDSILYAVGDKGTILKSTTAGETWVAETGGTSENLYAIWGADAGTIYAVGQNGIILRHR